MTRSLWLRYRKAARRACACRRWSEIIVKQAGKLRSKVIRAFRIRRACRRFSRFRPAVPRPLLWVGLPAQNPWSRPAVQKPEKGDHAHYLDKLSFRPMHAHGGMVVVGDGIGHLRRGLGKGSHGFFSVGKMRTVIEIPHIVQPCLGCAEAFRSKDHMRLAIHAAGGK